MQQLFVFIRKEFYHVFRDRRTLLIMFALPVIQIVLFGYALSSEVKDIGITIFDQAHDVYSEQIVDRIQTSKYFKMTKPVLNFEDVEERFRDGTIKCAVVIPSTFGPDLFHSGKTQIQIIADAADPNTASLVENYLRTIIAGYLQEQNNSRAVSYQIIPELRKLYNEEENGSLNFVPGVIALIFMIVCTTLTSVSVVKEKELGTMEILLVSPFRPIMVLIAKAIPYLVLSIVNLAIILALSVFLLNVEIKGSVVLLVAESILFIITCLSLGLLISNVTSSQQVAMLASMMGMMLPTLLLTGFLFPLENMPWIFRVVSNIVPSKYFYTIVKAVMLKGLSINAVWKETLILAGMTLFLLANALRNFKTRLT